MAALDSTDSSCRRRALALTRRIGQEMRPDMYHHAVSRGHRRTMNDFIAPSPVPDACRSPSSAPPPARPTPPGSGGWPSPAAPPAAWARSCPRSPHRSQRSLLLVPEDVQPHGVGVPCDRETLTDRDTREAECRRVCGAASSRYAGQGGSGHNGAGRGERCGVGCSMAPGSGQQQLQQPFEDRSDMFAHVINLHGVGGHAPGRSPVAGVLGVRHGHVLSEELLAPSPVDLVMPSERPSAARRTGGRARLPSHDPGDFYLHPCPDCRTPLP